MSDSLPQPTAFYCDLSAMNAAQRQQHTANTQQLFQSIHEIRELSDGYAFRADQGYFTRAAEFIALERLCCPFFDFTLAISAGDASFWLHITGPHGVKAFMQAEFGEVLARRP
jgi:hypothetical protein